MLCDSDSDLKLTLTFSDILQSDKFYFSVRIWVFKKSKKYSIWSATSSDIRSFLLTRRLLAAVCKIGFYQTQFLPCQTLLRSDAWTTLPSTPFPFISLPFGNTNQMFLLMCQRYFTSRLAFEGQMFHNCEHEDTISLHFWNTNHFLLLMYQRSKFPNVS